MSIKKYTKRIFRIWLLPLTSLLVGMTVFAAYFPALLHQDSITRWSWAYSSFHEKGILQPTDYWHPFVTSVYHAVIQLHLPVWTVHFVQLLAFFGGYLTLAHSLFPSLKQRIVAAVFLLVPTTWHYATLQALDTWLTIGLLWLIWSLLKLWNQKLVPRQQLGLGSITFCAAFLVFSSRYNAYPMVLPILLLPFMMKYSWRSSCLSGIIVLLAFCATLNFKGPYELKKAYTSHIWMAVDVIGVWKEIHQKHPEAKPLIAEKIGNMEDLMNAYNPENFDSLIWKTNFFSSNNIAQIKKEIEADFWNYVFNFPIAFLKVKARTFSNPFGFSNPIGPWYFSTTPDLYLDLMGASQLSNRSLWLKSTWVIEQTLWKFFDNFYLLFRPFIWWLIWIPLLFLSILKRKTPASAIIIFLLSAAYFSTFFVFANGYILRYSFPLWILFLFGTLSLMRGSSLTSPKMGAF